MNLLIPSTFVEVTTLVISYVHALVSMAAKRITVLMDDDLDKKLRLMQARQISKTNSSVSYSKVINQTLRAQLK